ncbi:hypothetical protein HDU87_005184 [Geranomyces variabilis]|uniref:Uncharacterized protein n=1 Tax=Geranomyces variabilis TaxID=109894 RepID=A0AAD5TIX1_9FUNG|nr:hypothetical protein HDU87_005184 [Geranomyces variabilis]
MSAVPATIKLGAEALSVLGLYGVYTQSQHHLPPGPYSQLAAGATAGAALSLLAHPLGARHFPETSAELRAAMPNTPLYRTILKSASGYACFFAVAEGLRTGYYKARLVDAARKGTKLPPRVDDAHWHATNFFAGGVGGLAYRAATLPYFSGPMDNPLLSRSGVGILVGTFVAMGAMLAGFGYVDETFGLDYHPERWHKLGDKVLD